MLLKEIKELIFSKYGENFQYVNNHVIEHIDREITAIDQNSINHIISDENIQILSQYIKDILDDADHPLKEYLHEAINQDSVIQVWGDNINQILSINGLMENIILKFGILQLIEKDEKKLIVMKRDQHKISEAVELLKTVSTDVHLLHSLEKVETRKKTTRTKILSCFFYQFTKLLDHDFSFSKGKIQKLSTDIMTQVFDSKKDYRIYKNTESFEYKGYYLTRYISSNQ